MVPIHVRWPWRDEGVAAIDNLHGDRRWRPFLETMGLADKPMQRGLFVIVKGPLAATWLATYTLSPTAGFSSA
jgi:hypothetical protein